MSEDYNKELCEERHKFITGEFESMDDRVKKVESRFLVIMTSLVLTLIGVIANLLIQLSGK
jgi:hypothetical protein